MRALTLWKQYVKTSLIRDMEFRTHVYASIVLGVTWAGLIYFIASIFFLDTNEIAGWSQNDVYILVTTWAMIHEAFNALCWTGVSQMTESITRGKFDVCLVRPVHPITQIIFSRFEISPAIESILYLCLLAVFIVRSDIPVTFWGAVGFSILCVCAFLIRLAVFLLLETLSFWFTNIENIKYIYYSVTEAARFPSVVFKTFEVILLTVIPIAYLGSVQTLFLVGRGSLALFAGTIVATVFFCGLALLVFHIGVRRYSSASS